MNGDGYAGDIAHAHAAGQSGHESLKRRYTVRIIDRIASAQHLADAAAEQADLDKAGGQSEKQPRTQQQENQINAQFAVNLIDPFVYQIAPFAYRINVYRIIYHKFRTPKQNRPSPMRRHTAEKARL